MVVLIEDPSAREELMKPTVIARGLLRTHTQPATNQEPGWGSPVPGRAPDAEPPERHRPPSPTAEVCNGRPSQRGAQGHLRC